MFFAYYFMFSSMQNVWVFTLSSNTTMTQNTQCSRWKTPFFRRHREHEWLALTESNPTEKSRTNWRQSPYQRAIKSRGAWEINQRRMGEDSSGDVTSKILFFLFDFFGSWCGAFSREKAKTEVFRVCKLGDNPLLEFGLVKFKEIIAQQLFFQGQ